MIEPMTVRLEIWPVAADARGIWLLSGMHPWEPPLPVMADCEPHSDVELTLSAHGVRDDTVLIHSTSWRVDGPCVRLTYVAVIRPVGPISELWPDARPVTADVAYAAGRPAVHGATEPPMPRRIDVLLHAIRHLWFLLDSDASASAALIEPWPSHLFALEPALAGLYGQVSQAV
jgi:hypothetical protein